MMTSPIRTLLFAAAALMLSGGVSAADEANGNVITLADFDSRATSGQWQTINDNVMGGISRGGTSVTADGHLRFAGATSLANNGGFSSVRMRADSNLAGFEGLAIRVRGDGRSYKLTAHISDRGMGRQIYYWKSFDTVAGEWQTMAIPFADLDPTIMGQRLPGPRLTGARVSSVGFIIYDKGAGDFCLDVDWIRAWRPGHADAAMETGADEPQDIVDTAIAAGAFNTLVKAVSAAKLVETLKSDGPFTVFAPTDAAFAALPVGTLQALLDEDGRATLTDILTFHVVPGRVTLADLLQRTWLATANGRRIPVHVQDGVIHIGGVAIIATDVECSNGVIHVLDAVALPGDDTIASTAKKAGTFATLLAAAEAAGLTPALTGAGPLTVFAPTDEAFARLPEGTVETLLQPENRDQLRRILQAHVVVGRVYSTDALAAGSIAYRDGALRVADAAIVSADIDTANGVIHVIDRVIIPDDSDRD